MALLALASPAGAADKPWSVRTAESLLARHPDPTRLDSAQPKWEYTHGLLLDALWRVGEATGEERYRRYVELYYDSMIDGDGGISTYRLDEFNIDRVEPGKALVALHGQVSAEKYRLALERLLKKK